MMKKVAIMSSSNTSKRGRPALTPEARENQLINAAYNLAEQQLNDGTASSQIIVHFLNLGTARAKVELKQKELECKKIEAQTASLEAAKQGTEMMEKALRAFRTYSGYEGDYEDEYEFED